MALLQFIHQINQSFNAASKTIEFPNNQSISLPQVGERLSESRTICLSPTDLVSKDPFAAGSLERPAVAKALSKLKLRSTILDGEVVAVDENGIPRFQLLQRFQKQPTAPTIYYVFDVLWSEGEDLTGK